MKEMSWRVIFGRTSKRCFHLLPDSANNDILLCVARGDEDREKYLTLL